MGWVDRGPPIPASAGGFGLLDLSMEAATEPMESICRSVNSYTGLAETSIRGNPEATTDADLALLQEATLPRHVVGLFGSLHALLAHGGELVERAEVVGIEASGRVDCDARSGEGSSCLLRWGGGSTYHI